MYPLGTLGLLVVCDHNVFSMCPVGIGPLVPSEVRYVVTKFRVASSYLKHAFVVGLADLRHHPLTAIAEDKKVLELRPQDTLGAEQLRNDRDHLDT